MRHEGTEVKGVAQMKESSQARRKRSERNRDLAILEKNLPTREELKRSAEILKTHIREGERAGDARHCCPECHEAGADNEVMK